MESLSVPPSVQAMVAATGGDDVPARYLRPEAAADAVTGAGEDQIPIIDHRRLLLELDHGGEESARLHRACQDWGFFQLVNHSVPDDVVEGMKASIQEFFQLPADTKRRFAQQQGRLEGYGQLFVVSEDQKLDWADMLFLYAQPPDSRKTELWPDQPATFRYSFAVKEISDSLLAAMSENLGLEREILTNGRYRSIEHRVVVDHREERLSVAAFHSPNTRAMIGPLKELMVGANGEEEAYATVEHERLRELFLATKLEGKSFLERMKLPSSSS